MKNEAGWEGAEFRERKRRREEEVEEEREEEEERSKRLVDIGGTTKSINGPTHSPGNPSHR